MSLAMLTIKPYGEIKQSTKWYTTEVTFASGVKQKQRKRVKPEVKWTFNFVGLEADRQYLEDFFNARAGDATAFYYMINGVQETVRFANDVLDTVVKRQIQEYVAYTAEVVLERI